MRRVRPVTSSGTSRSSSSHPKERSWPGSVPGSSPRTPASSPRSRGRCRTPSSGRAEGADAVDSTLIGVDTSRRQVGDITDDVERFCAGRGDGLCSVFVPHATAGAALMETGSGSEADLVDTLERLLPRDDRYRHRHGAPGHGADHLLPVLVSPSMTVPVLGGRMQLGTWQSVVLV